MSSNKRHVRPTKLSKDDLSGLTMKDYYPTREEKETNSKTRMVNIQEELRKLFSVPKNEIPNKDEYPLLFYELPTLWAMIEERKFKFWEPKDQVMIMEMIRLKLEVLNNSKSEEDAEKDMGINLAERYLYPKVGRKS